MPTAVDLIKSLLTRELEATHAFIAILDRESEVLFSGSNPDELADTTQAKWLRANSLNSLHMERIALIKSMKNSEDEYELAFNDAQIKSLWDQLTPALVQAHTKNAENGLVLSQLLKSTEAAQAVLRNAINSDAVYSASGHTVNHGARILATT